jgi:hypothetical protein
LRIRIEGNARVLENSMGGHYKGCKTLGVSEKGGVVDTRFHS